MDFDIINRVYQRDYNQLMSTAIKITNDDFLSKDIIQDAVLKIMIWGGHIENDRHLGILFTKTVKQLCHNFFKRQEIRKKIQEDLYGLELEDANSRIEYYPLANNIVKRIGRLTKSQQSVIIGTFYEGLEWKELGEKYNIKHTSVPSIKKQALDHLKKPVEKHGNKGDQTDLIIRLRKQKYTYDDISKITGVSILSCRRAFGNRNYRKKSS